LELTVAVADLAPDDAALCLLGIEVLEPLAELHWRELADALDSALARSVPLRKAMSCVWLGDVPDELERRWRGHLRPEDDIGSHGSDSA
jgi:hypothetical protein